MDPQKSQWLNCFLYIIDNNWVIIHSYMDIFSGKKNFRKWFEQEIIHSYMDNFCSYKSYHIIYVTFPFELIRFEKLCAGHYIGNLARLVMLKLTEEGLLFQGKGSSKLSEWHTFTATNLSDVEKYDFLSHYLFLVHCLRCIFWLWFDLVIIYTSQVCMYTENNFFIVPVWIIN